MGVVGGRLWPQEKQAQKEKCQGQLYTLDGGDHKRGIYADIWLLQTSGASSRSSTSAIRPRSQHSRAIPNPQPGEKADPPY